MPDARLQRTREHYPEGVPQFCEQGLPSAADVLGILKPYRIHDHIPRIDDDIPRWLSDQIASQSEVPRQPLAAADVLECGAAFHVRVQPRLLSTDPQSTDDPLWPWVYRCARCGQEPVTVLGHRCWECWVLACA